MPSIVGEEKKEQVLLPDYLKALQVVSLENMSEEKLFLHMPEDFQKIWPQIRRGLLSGATLKVKTPLGTLEAWVETEPIYESTKYPIGHPNNDGRLLCKRVLWYRYLDGPIAKDNVQEYLIQILWINPEINSNIRKEK